MRLLRPREDPRTFALAMVGVKMGDRLLQIGAGDGRLLAALASKVGLTGRACGIDEAEEGIARMQEAAAREGVLIEPQQAPADALPFEAAAFDVVILHEMLRDASPENRAVIVAEVVRVLRSGGRCLIVDRASRGGLAGLFGGSRPADPTYKPEELLRAGGFKAVRTLGEGTGLRFVEGIVTKTPA